MWNVHTKNPKASSGQTQHNAMGNVCFNAPKRQILKERAQRSRSMGAGTAILNSSRRFNSQSNAMTNKTVGTARFSSFSIFQRLKCRSSTRDRTFLAILPSEFWQTFFEVSDGRGRAINNEPSWVAFQRSWLWPGLERRWPVKCNRAGTKTKTDQARTLQKTRKSPHP